MFANAHDSVSVNLNFYDPGYGGRVVWHSSFQPRSKDTWGS